MGKWQECDCGFADPKGGYESCPECGATFREESAAVDEATPEGWYGLPPDVGVEDHSVASPGEDPKPPHTPALRWLADREAVATQEWQDGFNAAYSYYAQQPAAVDGVCKGTHCCPACGRCYDCHRPVLECLAAQQGGEA